MIERMNKEVEDAVAEKQSDMQLAIEDAGLQRTSAISQLENQKMELQQKITDMELVNYLYNRVGC